jgi:hypothetical protein
VAKECHAAKKARRRPRFHGVSVQEDRARIEPGERSLGAILQVPAVQLHLGNAAGHMLAAERLAANLAAERLASNPAAIPVPLCFALAPGAVIYDWENELVQDKGGRGRVELGLAAISAFVSGHAGNWTLEDLRQELMHEVDRRVQEQIVLEDAPEELRDRSDKLEKYVRQHVHQALRFGFWLAPVELPILPGNEQAVQRLKEKRGNPESMKTMKGRSAGDGRMLPETFYTMLKDALASVAELKFSQKVLATHIGLIQSTLTGYLNDPAYGPTWRILTQAWKVRRGAAALEVCKNLGWHDPLH